MAQRQQAQSLEEWEIPSGWRWCSLADVIVGGLPIIGDVEAKKKYINDAGTIPLIQSGDLKDRKTLQTNNRVTQNDVDNKFTKPPLHGRKLLMAAAREIMGQVGILEADQTVVTNHVVQSIVPKEEEMILDFLFYYFILQQTRNRLQKRLAPRSTSISPKITASLKVVVPPLLQQKRIVERIEVSTRDIEKCQLLLNKQKDDTLNALHTALRETLTDDRVRTWAGALSMHDLLIITDNDQQEQKIDNHAYEQYGDYPYIDAETIEPLTGRLLNLQSLKVRALALKMLPVLDNVQGTLLLDPDNVNEGPIHKMRITHLQQNQVGYHPKLLHLTIQDQTSVLPEFIFWSLLGCTPSRDGLRFGDTNITPTYLREAILPFPHIHEQVSIVNHLNAIKRSISHMRRKQDEEEKHIEGLKQNILEKAFRGLL